MFVKPVVVVVDGCVSSARVRRVARPTFDDATAAIQYISVSKQQTQTENK